MVRARNPLPTEPRVRGWWESPAVLAVAGTLALHLLAVTLADAMVVLHPPAADPPPPELELVEIEPPPVVLPPSPPPVAPPPAVVHHVAAMRPAAPPSPEPPPAAPPPSPPASGGGPVVTEDDIAPAATGVTVAIGARTTGHVGRGGTGTGTGGGAGSADVAPMSVATIKTRAMPRGDYSFEEAKDYPAEARRLGIDGKIRVKLVVDARGVVTSAVLLDRLGHGLDELALRRATAIRFDPATDTDDHPVASVVVWTFDLALPK